MRIEYSHLSPVEKELHFIRWCDSGNIEMFLFDLDDTICPTRNLFKINMDKAYDFLARRNSAILREKWKDEIEEINNRLYETLGVNPNRWDHVVKELATRYSLDCEVGEETKRIFQQIYTTPLSWLEEAEEGLEFIKKVGMPMGIVTHAGIEWTWKKYGWLKRLERYVKWDDVYLIDENGHKTVESWKKAFAYFKLEPKHLAVVGDSPRSDINPAWKAGVRHCFLVEDPNQWSVHNQSVDPAVYRIRSLNEIPSSVWGN